MTVREQGVPGGLRVLLWLYMIGSLALMIAGGVAIGDRHWRSEALREAQYRAEAAEVRELGGVEAAKDLANAADGIGRRRIASGFLWCTVGLALIAAWLVAWAASRVGPARLEGGPDVR